MMADQSPQPLPEKSSPDVPKSLNKKSLVEKLFVGHLDNCHWMDNPLLLLFKVKCRILR
jgi:hypothetical protein